ncbi:MAG: ABC transporter substrate-binding protein [Candidatus Obscuribacterales bacterium]|nr:ABC transporter substrate-binding protein [Candidatus Obscuribacterales bacterium]
MQVLILALFLTLFPGCKRTQTTPTPSQSQSDKVPRLVSFAPSNTELIYSVGAEDCLIAVSTNCKYPAAALKKPRAGSFLNAKFEKLTAMKPDLALLVSGQEGLATQLDKFSIRNQILPNKKLADISSNLNILGKICRKENRASQISADFDKALLDFQTILSGCPQQKILFCVWTDPSICVGGESFLDDVITACGAINTTAEFKSSYPKLTAEKIISTKPDLLVLPHEVELNQADILSRPPWSSLNAVKSGRVIYLPEAKSDHLSRPTLRILTGLHWLATRLHPDKSAALDRWLKSNDYLILSRDKH